MHIFLKAASVTVIAAAICSAGVSPAWAQTDEKREKAIDLLTDAAATQEAEDRDIVEEQGPADREGYSPSYPTFQLLALSNDKEVSLGLTLDHSTIAVDPDDRLKQSARSLRFSLHGFAPIDKNGGTRFVNLARPMSGSRIKIGLGYYFSNYTLRQADINAAVRVMNLSFDNCTRERLNDWAAAKPEATRQLLVKYNQVIATLKNDDRLETEQALSVVEGEEFANLATYAAVAKHRQDQAFIELSASKDSSEFKELQAAVNRCRIGTGGDFQNNEDLIAAYGDGAPIDTSLDGVTGRAPTFFVGGDAALGRKGHSFLNRTSFAIEDMNRGEYELSAFAGVIGGNGLWSLRGGVSHSRTYSDQDEVNLCQATLTPGLTQCLTGPDGTPTRKRVTALTLEGRRLVTLAGTKFPVGVAPLFAFNPDNSGYSIDVPIYFAPDKDGKLTGGVQFGYASEKKNLSFGLFVGIPFGVFQ